MVSHDVEPHRSLAAAIIEAATASDSASLAPLLLQSTDETRDFIFEHARKGLLDPASTTLTQNECVRLILSYPKNVPSPLALPAILDVICTQRLAMR